MKAKVEALVTGYTATPAAALKCDRVSNQICVKALDHALSAGLGISLASFRARHHARLATLGTGFNAILFFT